MDMQVPAAVKAAASAASASAMAAITQARALGGAQHLCFTAAGSTYAMSIASIKEIIEFGSVTPIPLMPAFIRGVINLRGSVVPVIDLAARLGYALAEPSRRTCVVIVEMRHDGDLFELGVVVDGVSEVLELGPADLEPAPNFGAQIRSDFIQAMARIRGRFVIVMCLAQVLSIDEVSSLASLGQAGGQREALA